MLLQNRIIPRFFTVFAGLVVCTSCIEATVEDHVAVPLPGMWAHIDSEQISREYISFKHGNYASYLSAKGHLVHDGMEIMHSIIAPR